MRTPSESTFQHTWLDTKVSVYCLPAVCISPQPITGPSPRTTELSAGLYWVTTNAFTCRHTVKRWCYCVVTLLVQVLVDSDILHPWTTPLGYQFVWRRGLLTHIILQFSDTWITSCHQKKQKKAKDIQTWDFDCCRD